MHGPCLGVLFVTQLLQPLLQLGGAGDSERDGSHSALQLSPDVGRVVAGKHIEAFLEKVVHTLLAHAAVSTGDEHPSFTRQGRGARDEEQADDSGEGDGGVHGTGVGVSHREGGGNKG